MPTPAPDTPAPARPSHPAVGASLGGILALGLALLFAGCASRNAAHQFPALARPEIEVLTPRPNIELFGLLMQLDLAPDALANSDVVEIDGRPARWRDWYALAITNHARFRNQTDGPMMRRYRDLATRGFYNDFFIGLLLQVPEVPHARLVPDADPGVIAAFGRGAEPAEARRQATEFLEALNAFYREIHFDRYLAEHAGHYALIRESVRQHRPPPGLLPEMERFYRRRFAHYRLVPSLNIPPGMGFGKTHDAGRTIYNVFGPFHFQHLEASPAEVGFADRERILEISVHEFGHSWVNPAVDALPADLMARSEPLYAPLAERMKPQGYPTWRICLYEHFVRAGEVIIARRLGRPSEADRILRDNVGKGFVHLPVLVEELERLDRTSGPDARYADFVATAVRRLLP